MKIREHLPGVISVLAASLTGIVAVTLMVLVAIEAATSNDPAGGVIRRLMYERPQVVIGLPVAGITSFALVVLLKQVSGPIEFEAAGIKFRGASGQVVLWLLCFVVMCAMIKWMW